MNRMEGVTTALTSVAMASSALIGKRKGSFGDFLIKEGGLAEPLGKDWNAGAALIKEGRELSGWFVGREQNRRAKALIQEGFAKQKQAEEQYQALVEAEGPKTEG